MNAPERSPTIVPIGRALLVGIAALGACVVGALFNPQQFFRAYLTAYLFYLGLPMGSMVLVMIYHLTGGGWGYMLRRILESAMRTLPLWAVLFLPIALGASYLYLWAQPDVVAADALLQKKTFYLNLPFFWGRMAVSFAGWLIVSGLLVRWSRRQAETGRPQIAMYATNLSGPGLLFYGITIHFAAVDWVMSLQPAFHSSIFGPLFASGQMLSGFCLGTIVLCTMVRRGAMSSTVSEKVLNDVGSLLFSFLIIWAYMVWFQFMLIWIANLRTDVTWYVPRMRGGWQWVALAIVLLHFIVPFFLLLSRSVKRSPRALGTIAAVILFMQLVFMEYQILPSFPAASMLDHWMDFVMPVGLGGIWLATFAWQLQRWPLEVAHDANRQIVLHLRASDEEERQWEESLAHG